MMHELSKEEVTFVKKNYLTEKQRKGRHIKQCEQVGGDILFKGLDGEEYTLRYKQSKAYTDYVFSKLKHRDVGVMNRGAGPLVQDKYGKINYKEENTIKQLDKKIKKENR
mgnify:FL=1